MGGTFNPVHFGHLVTAEQALHRFGLDKVIFIPTGNPPHKKELLMPAIERYKMAVIATADNPHFEVSRLEVDRPGISYTIDTIEALIKIYKVGKFYFITGADAILDILSWKEASKLASLTSFIAATRPGYSLEMLNEKLSKLSFKPDINVLEVPALAISSSDIRHRVLEKEPIRYLLPGNVCSYIYKRGFYR
jgi:nicotinate-nucleotide adenylyltransferase